MATPVNFYLAGKNAVDHPACVITCSVTPLITLDNLKSRIRERVGRVPASVAYNIGFAWQGNGVYATHASIHRHNLEPAAQWRFIGYSTADFTGTPVIDSGLLTAVDSLTLGQLDWGTSPLGSGAFDSFYGQKESVFFFGSRLNLLSAIIYISDTGNSAGYIDISRAYLGDGREFSLNPTTYRLGWKEKTQVWDTTSGSQRSDDSNPYRQIQIDYKKLSEADRSYLFDVFRWAGSRKDVYLSCFPAETGERKRDYAMNGVIQPPLPDFVTDFVMERNDTTFTIREA